MTALALAHGRDHDLPPRWDDVPVDWSEWSSHRYGPTSLVWHVRPEDLACEKCGAVDESDVCLGRRPPPPGTSFTTWRTKRTRRRGLEYRVRQQVPAWAVVDLVAYRCQHCGHDQVHDHRTDQVWDLDASDYTNDGSHESGQGILL